MYIHTVLPETLAKLWGKMPSRNVEFFLNYGIRIPLSMISKIYSVLSCPCTKIRSVVTCEAANRQTDTQTYKHRYTDIQTLGIT